MYPLRIFTKNVELLTEIDQYESMITPGGGPASGIFSSSSTKTRWIYHSWK